MTMFGNVSGTVDGPCTFKNGPVAFTQGAAGAGLIMPDAGKIWYVNKNKVTGITGNGTTPANAFLTVTEGIAALTNYDVLIIMPGNYDEAAKMTLTGLKGVKIFGYGTGFQWNEGSTCIRDVSFADDDLLDITGCMAIEIAGISFISTAAYDAINFTGLNYSTHIHDCCFVGDVGGGAVQDYGVNLGTANGPDTYIHHCRFFHNDAVAIQVGTNQRFCCHNCLFIVADASIGINITGAASSYQAIWDCNFMGTAGDSGDQGIDIGAGTSDGKLLIVNCHLGGCTLDGGGTGAEVGVVRCFENDASGGALIDPT